MLPPPELVVPGSTVERRLEFAAQSGEIVPEQNSQPTDSANSEASEEDSKSSAEASDKSQVKITVLPNAGGTSLLGLVSGSILLGLGGLLLRKIRH